MFADPMPSPEALSELYGAAHFNTSYNPAGDTELLRKRDVQYLQDRDALLPFAQGGRLLDFGCGNGRFLGVFPATFEKYGYEFNRVTTEYVRGSSNVHVLDTVSNLAALDDGFFDVVMMRGVIEHLMDPEESVALLARKLRSGGHFFICATPNIDSPCALVYGLDWNQFNPPYHIHFFSPRTLAVMFARHGLALISTQMPYLGTPYEAVDRDAGEFIAGAQALHSGGVPEGRGPPFPGTMMTLVFRRS